MNTRVTGKHNSWLPLRPQGQTARAVTRSPRSRLTKSRSHLRSQTPRSGATAGMRRRASCCGGRWLGCRVDKVKITERSRLANRVGYSENGCTDVPGRGFGPHIVCSWIQTPPTPRTTSAGHIADIHGSVCSIHEVCIPKIADSKVTPFQNCFV